MESFPFGKYKGMNLHEIYRVNKDYLASFVSGNVPWAVSMRDKYPQLVDTVRDFLDQMAHEPVETTKIRVVSSPTQGRMIIEGVSQEEMHQIQELIEAMNQSRI